MDTYKVLIISMIVALAGCAQEGGAGRSEGVTSPVPSPSAQVIEGKFDVGGHKLFMRCEGSGSPTIVYLHGAIDDADFSSEASSDRIRSSLSDRYRFCAYDRRNVGKSDTVKGLYDGKTAVAELHALLGAAGVDPPYVLLAASFGGLIAHTYAATFPDEVQGMVLLDAAVPDEFDLEHLLPKDMRLSPNEDERPELISHFRTYQQANALEAPDIPVTYLLATPSDWPTYGDPEWDKAIIPTIRGYVEGFSQSEFKEVKSPHYMEAAVPERIAQEVEALISAS